jgi:hypothetical protein
MNSNDQYFLVAFFFTYDFELSLSLIKGAISSFTEMTN